MLSSTSCPPRRRERMSRRSPKTDRPTPHTSSFDDQDAVPKEMSISYTDPAAPADRAGGSRQVLATTSTLGPQRKTGTSPPGSPHPRCGTR